MSKPTVKALRAKVTELLHLVDIVERYNALEKEIKADMVELRYNEMAIPGEGRVFISTSERTTITPELAVAELGEEMASKVIVIKKSVSNDILTALVKASVVPQAQYDAVMAAAKRTPTISLYVRPLK